MTESLAEIFGPSMLISTFLIVLSLALLSMLVRRTIFPSPRSRAPLLLQAGPGELPGVNKPEVGLRVLCRKCAVANPSHVEKCVCCGHSLYVECRCGQRNVRSNDVCMSCGERLRRRRIEFEDLIQASRLQLFGPGRMPSKAQQLDVSVLVFSVIVAVTILFLVLPKIEGIVEERAADREEQLRRHF